MNSKNIPLCVPSVGSEEMEAVLEVLKSGWMAHGSKNHEFEEQFKRYLNVEHAVTMNSCTSALQLALQAAGITGEVLVPSFTFVASVNAILAAGAVPVLVDIEEDTRNISSEAILDGISEKTEAIMPVHYGGLPADMPTIIRIAEERGLRVIEDSAECLGGRYNGAMPGSYDMGCFSFFPTKNITTGEGGMFTTNDAQLAARVRSLAAHGIDSTTYQREIAERPWIRIASEFGYNFRMSNVLAAIGVEQMKKIDRMIADRQRVAKKYMDELSEIPSIKIQKAINGFEHSWQMFTVLVPKTIRDGFLLYLRSKGIGASVHFDPPVHEQPYYKNLKRGSDLSVTENVSKSIISLPIFPGMNDGDVGYVCDTFKSYEKLN